MQTEFQTTTQRHYSLFAMANENLTAARAAQLAAFNAADANPTYANIQAFMDADKAVKDAETYLKQVKMMQKHFRGPQ